MSIFDNFNNQGFDNADAFEEMCCQLFETWGVFQMGFGDSWTFVRIRGDGGDGGIEAYWLNEDNGDCIAIQAKWFRQTLKSDQYRQIEKSIDTAAALRSSLRYYIVCVPHNRTSMKNGRGGVVRGEDESWCTFAKSLLRKHPLLKLELWDEAELHRLLLKPVNEGFWRFWFQKSAINPETIGIALNKTVEGLRDRYIPELADGGAMSLFLDGFFGSIASRKALIKDIDCCIATCRELDSVTNSFIEVGAQLSEEQKKNAFSCHNALVNYVQILDEWRRVAFTEPNKLIEFEDYAIDYAAIENFEMTIREIKQEHKYHGHIDLLLDLFDEFRDMPSEYQIIRMERNAFSSCHCLVIGEQGTGKTCGLTSKAIDYFNSGKHLPILIRATEISDNSSWRDIICNALGLGGDWDEPVIWQALSASATLRDELDGEILVRAKVAILIDGLDEKPTAVQWVRRIRQADAITKKFPRIKFVYSTRPSGIDIGEDRNLRKCIHYIDNKGDVPTYKLFDHYIDYYSIDLAGNTRCKWMLHTPMELSMFCTA